MPLHEAAPQRRRDTKTQAQARQSVEFRQRPDDEQVIPVPGLVQDGIGFVRGKEIEERFIDEDICSLAGADFGQGQDFIGRRQGARRIVGIADDDAVHLAAGPAQPFPGKGKVIVFFQVLIADNGPNSPCRPFVFTEGRDGQQDPLRPESMHIEIKKFGCAIAQQDSPAWYAVGPF